METGQLENKPIEINQQMATLEIERQKNGRDWTLLHKAEKMNIVKIMMYLPLYYPRTYLR